MLAFCLDDEQPARSVVCKDKDEKEGSINTLALMGQRCVSEFAFRILGTWQAFIFGGILGGFSHHITKTVIIQLHTFSKAKDSHNGRFNCVSCIKSN